MEHTSAWGGPFEFQLAATNWTTEEGPAGDTQAWAAPAAGHPLEYSSIVDIFGSSCSLQPYVVPATSSSNSTSSGRQQQLVEYNYYNYCAAAVQHHHPTGKGTTTTHEDLPSSEQQMQIYVNNPIELFNKKYEEFNKEYRAEALKWKMHRYPPSIRDLDDDGLYTVPRVVAIGPYHRYGRDHLKEAEKVKHMAAICCMHLGLKVKVKDLYQEVVSAAENIKARGLYDKDVMAGMDYEQEFLPMMFYDACFLVMYMVKITGTEGNRELFDFFENNGRHIAHDIMLLENQIPWEVVDAVMNKCRPDSLEIKKSFIRNFKYGRLQDVFNFARPYVDWDEAYKEAPHLLGLVRLCVVGKRSSSSSKFEVPNLDSDKFKSVAISAGAIELAEMGIFLKANETTDEFPADMDLGRKWIIFAELPIVPLSLDNLRASVLVNMAALELCTTQDFFDKDAKPEDSAVCSYLLLLCMLVHREEDVHELRTKGILKGAGLTNNKTLDFLTSLQSLRKGRSYGEVIVQIEDYRMKMWGWWLWLYKFIYQNRKTIAGSVSAVGAVLGIFGTLMKLKGAH